MKRMVTQAIYDETKYLIRKFPNATQQQIGKLVNSGWGGISQRTVWLIKESSSYDEYLQNQANHHMKENQKIISKTAEPVADENPTIADSPDEVTNGINLRRIAELLWCIAYELDKETLPLSAFKNKEGNTNG